MLKGFKKVTAFICVVALALTLIPVTPFVLEVKAETGTIIASDDFEGSTTLFSGRGDAKVEITSEVKHEGSQSLKVSDRGDGTWRGDEFAAAMLLKPNGKYTVSACVYLPAEATPTEFKIGGSIEWADSSSSSNKWPQFASVTDVKPGEWTTLEGTIELTDEAFTSYSIVIECMTEKQDFYIDDFVLTDFSDNRTKTSDVVSSDDFEGSTTIFSGRGDAKVEITSEFKHEGSQSLKVSDRGDGTWRGDEFAAASVLKPSGKYTVSAWVYLPDEATATEFKIGGSIEWADSSSSSNKWPQFASVADVKSGEWTKIEGTIDLTDEAFTSYSIVIECMTEKQDFYIDDFILTSSGAAPVAPIIEKADAIKGEPLPVIDFEDGDGGFTGRSDGNVTVAVTDEQAHSGTGSLKVTGRTSAWNGPTLDVTKNTSSDTEFELSVWVRLADGTPDTIMQLSTQIGDSTYKQFEGAGNKQTASADKWVELKGTYRYSTFDTVSVYIETNDAGKEASFYIDDVSFVALGSQELSIQDLTPLKDIYNDYFLIGTAVNLTDFGGVRSELLTKHFNSVTAENSMKPDALQRQKDVFTFDSADAILDAAIANNMIMIGHTLMWHQQSPTWMYQNVTKEEATKNLQDHIKTVLTHFKQEYNGKIQAWDVVNEAMNDGITNPSDWRSALRESEWIKAVGTDLVEIAFRAAAEVAEPDVMLYYNDYNLDTPAKREAVYYMVKELKEKGVKIDGIGMQGHYNMGTSAQNVEDSIKRFAELGVKVSITELDVTVNQAQGLAQLTPEQEKEQAFRYAELFQVFKKYADVVERVTFWGMDDGSSWRGDRFPLAFDRNYQAKEVYYAIANPEQYYTDNFVKPAESLMSYAQYGTPTVDGDIDEIWADAESIPVSSFVMAWQGATATAKTLWNEDNLFVLFEVTDSLLNNASENVYEQDSIEVFLDENNGKTSAYQLDDGQYRVSYENLQSFGSQGATEGFNSAAKVVTGGYIVEVQIPFNTIKGSEGSIIGFEAQVNDADASGSRVSMAKWNDLTDYSWQNTEKWGRLTLTKSMFKDLAQVNWARNAIETLAAAGIITEKTPGAFEPNAYITHGEFMAALNKTLAYIGIEADISSKANFEANAPITREEMFDLASLALLLIDSDSKADASVLDAYTDTSDISDYAIEGTALLVQNAIITGMSGNTLNPKGNATRAQAAVLLFKLLEK